MGQHESSARLFPCYDDDEVESPPFPFARFESLMAAAHLSHIRNPRETRFPIWDWQTKRAPYWRWALAHQFLESGYAWPCDEDTFAAYDLLRTRDRGLAPIAGIQPIVDAILIYERNTQTRWLLESHLLLDELPSNLAEKLGLKPVTIRYYESWFFDVRRWLSKSSWVHSRVLGGSEWFGFADDDLAPIWRRVAYYTKQERMLDLAVVVSTGIGRGRFSDEECDHMLLWIEEMRMSTVTQPDRVIQYQLRREADRVGAHPSSYYFPRRKRSRIQGAATGSNPPAT